MIKQLLCFLFGHQPTELEKTYFRFDPETCVTLHDPFAHSPCDDLQEADGKSIKYRCERCGLTWVDDELY